jgi:AcrR family transcriptional regulator
MTKTLFKEREKERREHEILLTARRLIRERGYAALNMDDLAEAVGISKPTLYQHFRSKEDLIIQVHIRGMQDIESYVCSSSEESPLERLRLALRTILRSRYGDQGLLADFDQETLKATFHTQPEVIALKQRILAHITRVVDEGKARGEITRAVSTPMICCLFLRLIGLPSTLQTVMQPDEALSDPEALAAVIEDVVGIFVRSIVQQKADA